MQGVSPRRLLSTTPPEEYDESDNRRTSLESIDPNDDSAFTPKTRGRRRTSSNAACCYYCPKFHTSLTQHFRRVSLVLIISSVVTIILCTYYAYMDANQMEYGPTDWQSCVLYGEAPPTTGFNTRFSLAAAAAGQQTVIFSMLAVTTLYRALHHPEWLVSTLTFTAYAFVGCFCYFSFAPSIPFPSSLTANVFTLMLFVRPEMYDDVKLDEDSPSYNKRGEVDSKSICQTAYQFNQIFLGNQYLAISMVALLFVLGLLAESRRRKVGLINNTATPHTAGRMNPSATLAGISFANWPTLRATNTPMFFSVVAFMGFGVMLYGKNSTAATALSCVLNPKEGTVIAALPSSFFPFAAGGLDIVTVLFVVSAMAVIRGTTRQRVSAFRLAAATSFLHCIMSWPSVVSGWRFSVLYGLWDSSCHEYFEDESTWFDPSTHNANLYCTAVRTALIGQVITFSSMHFSVIACIRCYLKNRDHPLELFDPNPPQEARALLFSDNVVRAA